MVQLKKNNSCNNFCYMKNIGWKFVWKLSFVPFVGGWENCW